MLIRVRKDKILTCLLSRGIVLKTIMSIFLLLNIPVSAHTQNDVKPFYYEKRVQYSSKVVSEQQVDSLITLDKVVIDGFDSDIPFYHYQNKGERNNHYVFLLHGLGGSKDDWLYPSMPYLQWSKNLTAIKDSLLSLGYNIVLPDAKYHGERSYELNFRPAENLAPMISKNPQDGIYFNNMMTSTVKDIRIIMDYIEKERESSNLTFGLIGYSMGSSVAILLNASDDRIKYVVACVPPLNHPEKELQELNWPQNIKNSLKVVTPQNYAAFQQSPILLLMGKNDFFYSEKWTLFMKIYQFKKKD